MRRLLVIVSLAVISFAQTAMAGTKPIANMPDYNGTYYGTPYTGGDCDSLPANCDSTAGRRMFNTLYRDNYERISGCAGERCGKHPGVDIAVVSGTQVRAALPGTVVSSKCDWNGVRGTGTLGFGGLVIIESNNPYVSGSKVYVSYAHLNKWDYYAIGQTVAQNAVIGLSGGDPIDPIKGVCPGGSGGQHLHFQVDKFAPTKNVRDILTPWYPYTRTEISDSDFEVTQKTHNPLPFVLGYAYNFTFAENNNKELWGAMNVSTFGVANSDLWIDSSSAYAYAGRSSWLGEVTCAYGDGKPCSREITLDANIFKRLVIRLNFTCYNNPVILWFRGSNDTWHNGGFYYNSARTYILGMSGLPYWNGIITDIMIDPSQGCTASPGPAEYFISQMYLLP